MVAPPGPLGVVCPKESGICNPSDQTETVVRILSIRPTCLSHCNNKKGLNVEAFYYTWFPGPDSNQRPID